MNAPAIRFRYKPGDRWTSANGLEIWIERGNKSENDVRVMVRTPPSGAAITLAQAAILTDGCFEAEDIAQERLVYRDLRTFEGWKKYRGLLKDIYLLGPSNGLAKYRAENAQVELPLFVEVEEDGDA